MGHAWEDFRGKTEPVEPFNRHLSRPAMLFNILEFVAALPRIIGFVLILALSPPNPVVRPAGSMDTNTESTCAMRVVQVRTSVRSQWQDTRYTRYTICEEQVAGIRLRPMNTGTPGTWVNQVPGYTRYTKFTGKQANRYSGTQAHYSM